MNSIQRIVSSTGVKVAIAAALLAGAGIYFFLSPGALLSAGGLKPTPTNPHPARTANEQALVEAITRRDAPALRAVLAKQPSLANMEFGQHEFGMMLGVCKSEGKPYYFVSLTLPLSEAVATGNAELVEALLDAGAKIDAKNGEALARAAVLSGPILYERPLEDYGAPEPTQAEIEAKAKALREKQDAILELLLKRGADPDAGNGAALVKVASHGTPERLETLLDAGATANIQGAMVAAQKREQGSDYYAPYGPGGRPLQADEIEAAKKADQQAGSAIFQRLLAAAKPSLASPSASGSAAPPASARKGVPLDEPLRTAISNDDIERAAELLAAGADPNMDGSWPLMVTIRGKDAAMLGLLLEHGADPDALDYDWLEGAAEESPAEIAVPLIRASRKVQGWGSEVLEEVVKDGRLEVAKELIAAGANPNAGRGDPLRAALRANNRQMIEMLLAAGAMPGASDCVTTAVRSGDPSLLRLLLDAGADARNGGNDYPLEVAVKERKKEMVVLLLEHGADAKSLSWKECYDTSEEIWLILKAAGASRGEMAGGPIVIRGGEPPKTVHLKQRSDSFFDRAE